METKDSVVCKWISRYSYFVDKYEVTITHNGKTYSVVTFGSLLECDDEIAERVYRAWHKGHNIK